MRVVPENVVDKVQFFETRLDGWAANAEAIGTTPAIVEDVAMKAAAAREAYRQQQMAQEAARCATATFQIALAALSTAGSAVIAQVRARAQSTGDGGVYALASLPAPSRGSTVAPPGTPTNFSFAIDANGAVMLAWECPNPRNAVGTMYHVRRQLGGSASGMPFEHLGTVGGKRFTDAMLPSGTGNATYEVQAVRSTAEGLPARFSVTLGVPASSAALALRSHGGRRRAA